MRPSQDKQPMIWNQSKEQSNLNCNNNYILSKLLSLYAHKYSLILLPKLNHIKEWHGLLSIQYGIYGTGKFKFVLQFTKNFPLECPKIRLLQKLTHPLINEQGQVDVDFLLPNWKYGQDCMLYNLLGKFHDMFIDITILDSQESQYNPQASQLYLKDVGQYAEQIKKEIQEHNKILYDQREDFELKFTPPTNDHQEIMDRLKQVNDKNISFEDKKKLMIDFLLNKNIK